VPVAHVQAVGNAPSASTSLTRTITSGVTTTVGNMLSIVGRGAGGCTITAVSDSRGNTWQIDLASASGQSCSSVASCIVAAGKQIVSGDVITITMSAVVNTEIACDEYSGVAVSAGQPVVDQSNNTHLSAAGAVTAATTVNSQAGDLAICAVGCSINAATFTLTAADPDSGGTWTQISINLGVSAAWQVGASSASLYSCTWTPSSSLNADASLVTYKSAVTASSATLSGSGTLGGSPAISVTPGPALSGAGTLAAAPYVSVPATLSGSGTLSGPWATGRQSAMTGSGTLAASPALSAAAGLSGSGTLAAGPALAGQAALSGSGTLAGAPVRPAAAALSGSGTLSGLWALSVQAALSGSGTLSAAGAPSAALSGSGTLSAGAVLAAAATMAGLGTLGGVAARAAAAGLSGSGTLSGGPAFQVSASLSGFGTLSGTPGVATPAAAVLSGSGTLGGVSVLSGTVTMSGTGTLRFTLISAGGVLSGTGTLAGSPVQAGGGATGTVDWTTAPASPRWAARPASARWAAGAAAPRWHAATADARWQAGPVSPRWRIIMAEFEPIAALSLEEINIAWTSDLDGTRIDPIAGNLTVQFAVPVSSGNEAAPAQPSTWYAASWLPGGTGKGYIAQGLVGTGAGTIVLAAGQKYDVWSKITGSPESPVKFAGVQAVY